MGNVALCLEKEMPNTYETLPVSSRIYQAKLKGKWRIDHCSSYVQNGAKYVLKAA